MSFSTATDDIWFVQNWAWWRLMDRASSMAADEADRLAFESSGAVQHLDLEGLSPSSRIRLGTTLSDAARVLAAELRSDPERPAIDEATAAALEDLRSHIAEHLVTRAVTEREGGHGP